MRRFSVRLSMSASVLALAAWASPAAAQSQAKLPPCAPGVTGPNCIPNEVETQTGQPVNPSNENAIVVTGSRIQRPNLESPVPITSVSPTELTNQGQVSVGDALNDLPALRSTFSQQNSGRFIGTAGQNFLDLRGLGTNRTLVLVNGRRFVTGSPGTFDVDVDDIPQDLIDRVDVVTGGESAVYGSDAVAGVVNFILKKNFDGFTVRGQGGESKYGDRPVDFVSATYGKNFADGRGNVAVNAEYTHAGELYFRDRAHFANVCGYEPTASGHPVNVFECGLRNPFVTNGGQIALLTCSGQGLAFEPNGNLTITPPADKSFICNGGTVVSNNPLVGSTLRETGDLAVGQDRISGAILGHYDFSDALKPFVEATAVRQKVYQEGQPTFFVGDLNSFFVNSFGANVPSIKCTNAFLNAQALATLEAFGVCGFDQNGNLAGTVPLDRFNVDMGARKEVDIRTTYRVVAGITGDFKNDWHYEVSFNYGHTKQDNQQHGDLYIQNPDGSPGPFELALDAVRGPNGTIVCGSGAPGCVPLDLFGDGAPSQAAINYVTRTSDLYQRATQEDFLAFLSGDSHHWFDLPGGPLGFSIGVEHRRETAETHADPISRVPGDTFFNAFPEFNPPAFKVSEAFGELNVPILKDLPGVHELTVSGAARYSHYNTSAKNTFAWNASAIYSPIRDLRFRGNYSKSVRVPTLSDLFTPNTVDFAFINDPCEQIGANNINLNPNRAANCAALGVPTTIQPGSPCISAAHPVGSPFVNCTADNFTMQVEDAGNPKLKAETGRSITLGAVFTPSFLPGFNLSVDYFSIRVSNLISQLGAQALVNQCVDLPSINNIFCSFIFPRTQFGLFQTPALIQTSFNFAKQTSRGIDFDLGYRHRFANGNRLELRGIATDTIERTNFTDITNPKFGTRVLSTLGDPHFSATGIINYGIGKFNLRWTTRYIGSMTEFAYEDTHKFPQGCTSAGCPPFQKDIADVGHINTGAVWYHDARIDYTINKYNFYVGVDNLFNRLPPLGLTGAGAGSGIYSNFGRFFYAGAVVSLK